MVSIFIRFQVLLISVTTLIHSRHLGNVKKRELCGDSGQGSQSQNSFLWKLKRDPPSYFFGTIHVPYTRVWEYIPENSKMAFQQSENIIFELDLTDTLTMSALARCQLLPHGEYLSNILPKDIYTRLKDHLEYVRQKLPGWMTADQRGKGLYADYLFNTIAGNWERKRPVWVMLMVNSLTESDIKSREIPVLDLYLAQEAEKMGKITGAVERVEEQCVPLNDLNFSQVLFALNQTLWQHESYRLANSAIPYTTDDLIHHYNCGDLNSIIFNHDTSQLPSLFNSTLPPNDLKTAKMIDSYFRTELIDKRNERMAERIERLLNNNPEESFFFAFGAGHFLGNDTVIDRLQRAGFDIEHVQPEDEIVQMRLQRRLKNKRKNKLQEEFGDLWVHMDAQSRSWLEQSRKERQKKYNSDKPFNDLWVRMDTPSPSLMQQLAESEFYNTGSSEDLATPGQSPFLHSGYTGSGSALTLPWLPVYILTVTVLEMVVQQHMRIL